MSKPCQTSLYDDEITDDGGAILRVRDKNATSLVVPRELDGRPVKRLAKSAFENRRNLTQVVLLPTLASIGDSAFGGCSALTRIELPETLESIGREAFRDCSSLTQVVLPSSVTKIGVEAFGSCAALTEVVLSPNVAQSRSARSAFALRYGASLFRKASRKSTNTRSTLAPPT